MRRSILLCIASILISFVSHAQALETIDTKVGQYFEHIDKWVADRDNAAASDSLAAVNDELSDYMNKILVKVPATLGYSFKTQGLTYVSSDDGKIRFYDWDTQTGGTMHFFTDLTQYSTTKGIKVHAIGKTSAREDPGCFYKTITTVKTKSNIVYVVSYATVGSNRDKGAGVEAYAIVNDKLVSVQLFKTKTKALSDISYSYDFFASGDIERFPEIHFSKDKKKLYVPIVDKKGAFTKAFLVYVFNGNNYVFDKSAK